MSDRYNVTDITPYFDVSCKMESVKVEMRDGVKLHTLIYFPPEFSGTAPVLLLRTPYSRTTWFELPDAHALENGFIYIMQATRGTGWSEGGAFDPVEYQYEISDAEDTLNWLVEQPFFNGHCACFGSSYPGWVQWAAAFTGHPALVAVSPMVAPLYGCRGCVRPGGGNYFSFPVNWMLNMHHRRHYGYAGVPDYEKMKLLDHLPWNECDLAAGYPENAPFRKFISCVDEPGKLLNGYRKHFPGIKVPAFITGGWFDGFREETVESFQLLKNGGSNEKVRNFSRLVIGPWGHAGLLNPEIFGEKNSTESEVERKYRFLGNLLADPECDPLPGEKQVRFFMLGENRWYDDDNWPPVNMHYETMYLHGNGLISPESPQKNAPCRSYISDPSKPVDSFQTGTFTENTDRSDVLVYTSDELTADMKIAGEIRVSFSASVTAVDTDFFVTLSDVYPDGRVMHCITGMVRARFRDSLDKAVLLEPGKVYDFEVIAGNCAVNFLAGHRMQVAVCGQNFPQFDRNAQSGKPIGTDRELFAAEVTLFHDAEHPAKLILPVI